MSSLGLFEQLEYHLYDLSAGLSHHYHGAWGKLWAYKWRGARGGVSFHDSGTNGATVMNPLPTVFIVDDDAAVLKSLTRLLRSARLNVVAFGSAQEFLEHHDPSALAVSCSTSRCPA